MRPLDPRFEQSGQVRDDGTHLRVVEGFRLAFVGQRDHAKNPGDTAGRRADMTGITTSWRGTVPLIVRRVFLEFGFSSRPPTPPAQASESRKRRRCGKRPPTWLRPWSARDGTYSASAIPPLRNADGSDGTGGRRGSGMTPTAVRAMHGPAGCPVDHWSLTLIGRAKYRSLHATVPRTFA